MNAHTLAARLARAARITGANIAAQVSAAATRAARTAADDAAAVLAGFLVTAGLIGFGAVGFAIAQGARGICATEDAPACVWVGPAQGNGRGLVVVNGPADPTGVELQRAAGARFEIVYDPRTGAYAAEPAR